MDQKRYESIMKRDFKYNLELYLYDNYLKNGTLNTSKDDFNKFIEKDLKVEIENYRQACQSLSSQIIKNELTIRDADIAILDWYKNNKSSLENYEKKFFTYFEKQLSKSEFEKEYQESKQCHYCGILEDDIKRLIENSDIKTKRLLTRGKSLEIDRIDPFGSYTKDNIILSCYWCNNAKTDEFSYFEFKKFIAPKIQEVWEIRLQRKLNPPEMKDLNDKAE